MRQYDKKALKEEFKELKEQLKVVLKPNQPDHPGHGHKPVKVEVPKSMVVTQEN